MKLRWDSTSVSRIAILLAGILSGITIGMQMGPISPLNLVYARRDWTFLNVAVACSALVLVGLGLILRERANEHRQQLNGDLLNTLLDHIPDNVFFKDLDSRFVRISAAMTKYLNLAHPADAVNKTDADIFSSEHAQQALADEKEIVRTGRPMIAKEEKETWPDGRETWVITTKVPVKGRHGDIIGTMGIAHNITDRKQTESRLRHLALHDALTGLPNRLSLEDLLSEAIAAAGPNQLMVGLLMLDVDRFRNVNDSLGHDLGNHLLESISQRLKQNLREHDIVARAGGDEFAIVIPNLSDKAELERLAQRVQVALAEPFVAGKRETALSASIGMAFFPDHGSTSDTLLCSADAAMYQAKKLGCGRYCFFSPSITESTRRQQLFESDLALACSRDEFVLHYQPLVEAHAGRIIGMEALLRWRHPEQGLIPPNQFIPLLEELGLMQEVGYWVLRNACHQAVDWQRLGLPSIRMAVNVSSQQFREGKIVESVQSALRESGMDPKLLELELTESRVLDDSETTIHILRSLKLIGVSLALDDFGTGWSSLSYLRRFPLDRLKIDRSFVRDIGSQRTADAMVKNILGLGRTLGIACIAEGVETRQQCEHLKRQGCPEMQGFYFSRPVTAAEATTLLRSAKCEPLGVSSDYRETGCNDAPIALRSPESAINPVQEARWVQ